MRAGSLRRSTPALPMRLAIGLTAVLGMAAPWVAGASPSDQPPGRPGKVKLADIGAHQMDVAWNAASGADHYLIYRDGVLVGRSALLFFSDIGLQPDTNYDYEVSAVDVQGVEGLKSKRENLDTADDDSGIDGSPPNVPLAVVAVPSTGRIDLTWTPSIDPESGVSEYRVFRDGILIARPAGPTFADTGLGDGVTHRYAIAAANGSGRQSAPSAPVSATTPGADTTPPTAPGTPAASAVDTNSVSLAWTAASDPESGVASYVIYRDGVQVGNPTGTSFTDTGLAPATSYSYEVSAINGVGMEGARSGGLVVTTASRPDTTPPSAPGALTASAVTATSAALTWAPASDPESGIDHYNVYRDGVVVGTATGSSFDDTGLSASTAYSYEVTAVNGAGLEGAASARLAVTTSSGADTTPPTVPGNLTGTATASDTVRLSWTASTDPESGVSGYNVYRDDTLVAAVVATQFVDGGLTGGTSYAYSVSAVNGDGVESARTPTMTVATPRAADVTPPAPPRALRITP